MTTGESRHIEVLEFLKLADRYNGELTSAVGTGATLSTIVAIDTPHKVDRFQLSYELNIFSPSLGSTRQNVRIQVREGEPVKSVSFLFPSAVWYEREVFDLVGIFFDGNSDLRRIMTDYGFRGHPLQKFFPVIGFTETRYCGFAKRVISEPISISQEYRVWKLAKTAW